MVYIFKDRLIRVEWTIYKGISPVKEDFSRSNVKVFLLGNREKYLLQARADKGTLYVDIPSGLEEGTYSIEAIWVKNMDHVFDTRSVCRSKKEDLFSITEFENEATNIGEGVVVLKVKSSTATYGYDGLSSYELAVLRGDWNGTEGEWLKHERYVSVLDSRGDSEVDTMSQKAITDELETQDNAIEDIRKDTEKLGDRVEEAEEKVNNMGDVVDEIKSHAPVSARPAGFKPDIDLTPEITVDRAWRDHEGNVIRDTYITRRGLRNEIIDITNQQVTDLKPGSVDPDDLSEATKQLIGNKSITNLPDEEDITVTDNQTLKLKDKEYAPKDYSGMGRVYLRKHYVNGVNTLTQHMMRKPNTIYIIQYDYCLSEQTIEIPSNCILQFEGGSLRNGYIKGSNTIIEGKLEGIFYPTIDFIGDWNVPFISSSMFNNKNEINLLKKLLKLSNDNVQNIIEITKGEYPVQHNNYVITEKIIELTSNTKLILEGNILLLPSSYISYQIIHIRDKVNVEIIGGGSIIGDKHTHLGTEGEWGHGIAIYNSNNVTIRDIKIEKCFGDCIYIGIGNKNINVERCTLNEGRRQGISVISGEMIVIDGCRISNVYGTEPEAAIDIEPNENDVIDNVIIRNCICENCTKGIIAQKLDRYINAKINKVYIDNCIVESNNICIMAYNASTVTLSNSNIKSKYIYTVNIERANYCKINNNYIEQIYSYDNGRCVLFGSANDNFFIEDNVFITPYSFIRPSDNNYIKGNFIKCNNFNFTDQGIYNFLFINNVFEGSINFLGLIEGVISNNIMKLTSSFNLRGLYNQCIKNIISNNKITYVGDEEIDELIFIRTEQNQISNNTFFIPDNKVKAVFKSSNYGNYYYNNKLFGIPIENMYDIILEKNIVIDNNVKTVDNFKIPSYLSNIYNGGLFYNTIERSAKYFVDSKFYNFNGSYSGDYHFLTTSNVQSIINNNQSETYFVNQTIDLKGAELNISEGSTIIYFSGSFMNGAIKGDNIRLIGAYILEDICNDVTVDVTYSNGNIIYDNSYKRNFIYVDREKRNFDGSNITDVGLSSQRPTGKGVSKGFQFYDLNLNKPIWWTGTNWVDATGATV